MNLKEHSQPHNLEKYSFIWSEVRLVVAAVSLLIGGHPVIYSIFVGTPLWHLAWVLLLLAWLISGVVSGYLFYRWYKGGQKLFGKKEQMDTIAFFVNVVSGINLGIAGLIGSNIGMAIVNYSYAIFAIVGIIYLATAYYMFNRWKASGERIFIS